MSKLKRILFIPDTHRPYHSKDAWRLALKAGKAFQPDRVIVLGDFADFYKVSAHSKDPQRKVDFQDELDDVSKGLDELEALKATHYDFVEGNHENRMQRYLWSSASELAGLRSLRVNELLDLPSRGWSYTPYKQHLRVGKLFITHEAGNAGFDAHRKAQSTYAENVVIGHTHRTGYSIVGNARGTAHVGAMFGWLGDVESIDYDHRIRALREWNHGIGIGHMEPDGAIHLRPVPFVRNRCVIDGELVKL